MSNGSSQSQPVLGQSAQPEADTSAALKPSEVLERAAALIEPEGAWTQGAFGRTSKGDALPGDAAACVCRCAMGAIDAAYGRGFWAPPEITDYLLRTIDADEGIGVWNDDPRRTQPEVVAALRKAAELARSEGQ